MSETLTPCSDWANLDPSVVVDNIRETTLFDADMIEAMLKFAIGSAARAARTASAEQTEPVAEMKGSYLYPLKSIPSGTKLYTAPGALQAEVERLRKDRKSCWEEFKALVKSSKEREGELKAENEQLKENSKRCAELDDVTIRQLGDRLRAAEADAERFKYVLSQIPANLGEVFCQCLTATDNDIIEAIDAARTAKPEVDHE